MRCVRALLLIGGCAFLFGCASGAKMENMAVTEQDQVSIAAFDPALKKSVHVAGVEGGEATNPAWTSEISNESFSLALKKTLKHYGLLSASGRYQLNVDMLNVDQPLLGFDMTVTTRIRYRLVDSETGQAVIDEVILAPYTATAGQAFLGVERLRIANEGSAKRNIQRFLDELAALRIAPESVSLSH